MFYGNVCLYHLGPDKKPEGVEIPFSRIIARQKPTCVVTVARVYHDTMNVAMAAAVCELAKTRFKNVVLLGTDDQYSFCEETMETVLVALVRKGVTNIAVPDTLLIHELKIGHTLVDKPPGIVNGFLIFENGGLIRAWRANPRNPTKGHYEGLPELNAEFEEDSLNEAATTEEVPVQLERVS